MKLARSVLLSMILIILIGSFQLMAQSGAATDTLKNLRPNIVFNELSDAEKETMATQTQIFLRDLYVNRDQKLSYYKNQLDPVPAIDTVVKNIGSMTTKEMEEAIYHIFVQQKDLHLNYIFPPPYSNYSSFLPFTFIRVATGKDFFQVRVNAVNNAIFDKYIPGMSAPQVGDIVLEYDGLPILKAVERLKMTSQGANEYGGFTRALGQMTYVPQRLHLVPEKDEVTIKLRSYATGKTYTITVPWLVQYNTALRLDETGKKLSKEDFNMGIDLWQEMFNAFISETDLEPISAFPNNPTNEPALKWGLITNPFGKFGYLKLLSFVPVNGNEFAMDEITRIVTEHFGDTDGLIFDVRGNGGGYIYLADALSQLFIPKEASVGQARLLNNDLNRHIFNNSAFGDFSKPEWKKVINEAEGTGRRYTDLAPFTYDNEANTRGQIYYKPVAVLTNARCYSATDLFSCAMQDNGAGIIFGEDPRTGAGGANVITHDLFKTIVGAPFEEIPSNHAMRVSWRQSVRFGKNAGKLIEDYGCLANYDVSLTPSDLTDGGKSQIDRITSQLSAISKLYRSYGRCELKSRDLILHKGDLSIDVSTAYTDMIQVLIDGKLVDEISVFSGYGEKTVSITLPVTLEAGKNNPVTFIGTDRLRNRLWNIKRNVILIDEKVVLSENGIDLDFSTAKTVSPLSVINYNAPEDGWNLVTPYLEVGYNPEYRNDVNSDAILLLDLKKSQKTTLSFNLAYDTEPDYDFVQVFVTNNNDSKLLLNTSGQSAMKGYSFDLSSFAGQDNVALHFRFVSDSYTTAQGARFASISLQ